MFLFLFSCAKIVINTETHKKNCKKQAQKAIYWRMGKSSAPGLHNSSFKRGGLWQTAFSFLRAV